MRERAERFEAAMKLPDGVKVNRILDLEDRVRELEREIDRAVTALLKAKG